MGSNQLSVDTLGLYGLQRSGKSKNATAKVHNCACFVHSTATEN